MKYSLSATEMQEIICDFKKMKRKICRWISKSGILQRKRAIRSPRILYHAAFAYISLGLTLYELSAYMKKQFQVDISHVSWGKWLKKLAPILLKFADTAAAKAHASNPENIEFAVDATSFPMEGTGEVARVHTVMQIGTGLPTQTLLTDQHIAETACHVQVTKGGLYLADRAYGRSRSVAHILDHSADFIFRISPNQIRLYRDENCKEKLNISEILKGERLSEVCWCQYQGRHYRVHLVGQLLPPEKQAEAEKRARKNAKRRQKKIKTETLLYSKWLLLLTSALETVEKVIEAYKKRWQIELLFKRGKSCLKFRKLRFAKEPHRVATVQLWLFAVKLCSTSIFYFLQKHPGDFSLYYLFNLAKFALA